MNRLRHASTSLRGTLVLVLVASAVLVAALTSTALVLAARANIYQARQDVLLAQFRDDSDQLLKRLNMRDDPEVVLFQAKNFAGRAALIDLRSTDTFGDLARSDVPQTIKDGWHDPSGALRFLRSSLHGEPVFFVGTVSSDLPRETGARVAIVTAYSLRPQQAQIEHLVGTAALIGGGGVLLSVVVGIWFGTMLTRPVRRLAERARRLDDEASTDRLRSRFRDIDDVSGALHDSAVTLSRTVTELRRREGHSRRLVSDVAHELRTPLTSMVAVAEILDDLDSADPDDRATAITVTRRGTARLAALVDELLELSRIDAGVTRARAVPVHLEAELSAIVDIVAPGDAVTVRCPPELVVETDPTLFRKIVSNLLTNAFRHGLPPVTISGHEDAGVVTIAVSDHGKGISTADAERVFERFTVLDSGRRNPDSTGLGLAIAREAAYLLSGDLTLDGRAERTTFVLSLPAHEQVPHGPRRSS